MLEAAALAGGRRQRAAAAGAQAGFKSASTVPNQREAAVVQFRKTAV